MITVRVWVMFEASADRLLSEPCLVLSDPDQSTISTWNNDGSTCCLSCLHYSWTELYLTFESTSIKV